MLTGVAEREGGFSLSPRAPWPIQLFIHMGYADARNKLSGGQKRLERHRESDMRGMCIP